MRKKKKKEDLGLGERISGDVRFVNKDGSFNVRRVGAKVKTPYQDLIEMSTLRFFSIIIGGFIFINIFFAILFLLAGDDALHGVDASVSVFVRFLYAFFFSIQTFTTVGYGTISPGNLTGNIIAGFDALIGLLSLAMATGLFFARFSKPKAYIIYSDNMLIAPFNGQTALMLRVANLRNNRIINLKAEVIVTYMEKEGDVLKRKYKNLPLEIEKITLFALGWTLVHPIDQNSPFYCKKPEDVESMQLEVIVHLEGYDETYVQSIHSSSSYLADDLK
ncbi:MAG TPA: transporter, partial [Saprospiraceae bacterium]|nr:transporter [Saprospiraceae bacterium]